MDISISCPNDKKQRESGKEPFIVADGQRISIVICDDDAEMILLLKTCIEEFFHTAKIEAYDIQTFQSAQEVLESDRYADIAFLDIETGSKTTGIQAGEHLRRHNPDVLLIMVTGYPQYIDEATEKNVFRYISKPFDKGRIERALRNAVKTVRETRKAALFTTAEGGRVICLKDIVYLEAQKQKHRVTLHTVRGDVEVKESFKQCMETLKGISFVQTHRSFMVNLRYVRSYDRMSVTLEVPAAKHDFSEKTEDPLKRSVTMTAYMSPRRFLSPFKDALIRYLEVNR